MKTNRVGNDESRVVDNYYSNTLKQGMEATSGIDIKIVERLQEWENREGHLPTFVKFYCELLDIQREATSRIIVTKSSLIENQVYDRLREGIPLLLFKDFRPDWEQVKTVFEQIALWIAKDTEDSSEEEYLRNIYCDRSLLGKVVGAWYRGHSLMTITEVHDIEDELLNSVVGAALKPFLLAYSRLLLPEVNQKLWRRKYCPICGGKPDFAYIDREEGARWLLCSRCDAEWLFFRLECPYCGTQNEDALSYFTDDQDSYLYRLYLCGECCTYIKAVDLRNAESEVLLPLERVMTLDMDRQAQEKGYKPGWLAWRQGKDVKFGI